MRLIDLHKEWMETGQLTGKGGLCNCVPRKYKRLLNDFKPEWYGLFWAYPLRYNQEKRRQYDSCAYPYTPLRQTIVLFICAIKGEL